MTGFANAADQAAPQVLTAPVAPVAPSFNPAAPTGVATQPITLDDGSIVVDGKRYQAAAAVKKIEHADTHIKTLEMENAAKDEVALKLLNRIEALERGQTHTDALDKLIAAAPVVAPVVQPEPAPIQAISTDELVSATYDKIKSEQLAVQQELNLNNCIAQAQAAFGDQFGTKVDAAGTEHGMNYDQVMEMARNQPTVFRKLFIPEGTPNGKPDTTRSTVSGLLGQSQIAAPQKHVRFTKMSSKDRALEINRRMAAKAIQ